MAYRFRSGDKSVTAGVRRIAAAEFAAAEAILANGRLSAARKVHEIRKVTKRLRALLRLVQNALPEARAETVSLRDAARRLSDLRDAGAVAEMLARLELGDAARETLARMIEASPKAPPGDAGKRLAACGRKLRQSATRASAWTLGDDGWDALAPGCLASYRRLKQARRRAAADPTDERIHDLRKRAKDYWYHTLLLRAVFPEVMDGYAGAAGALCDDLGDWRDFGQLEAALLALPERTEGRAAALAQIPALRKQALRRGLQTVRRLTAETPRDYAHRLGIWWRQAF